jgi:8-amino-7-oxononanoate synthase
MMRWSPSISSMGLRPSEFHVKQETPSALRFLDRAIEDAARHKLLRDRPPPTADVHRSFCSNDYLALAHRPPPLRASGSGASRLVAGERLEHFLLEEAAAQWVDLPSALVFTSGYAANVGLLSSLASPQDLIVSDALNHASLVDGARLSRARVAVVPHLDLAAVERALVDRGRGHAFVVTESYFSMDADSPDLRALRDLCDAHDAALIVDEAHALGVLGRDGRGLCFEAGVRPDALVGTFGKAFGAAGAFVAGCPSLTTWLWNRARTFVFSTGLSPAVAAAAHQGLETARAEPWRRERVLASAARLRHGFFELGLRVLGFGHVIPWVVGEPAAAVTVASAIRAAGIDIRAIRPPSVRPGTARLRFTVTAAHDPTDIERAVRAVGSAQALGGAP